MCESGWKSEGSLFFANSSLLRPDQLTPSNAAITLPPHVHPALGLAGHSRPLFFFSISPSLDEGLAYSAGWGGTIRGPPAPNCWFQSAVLLALWGLLAHGLGANPQRKQARLQQRPRLRLGPAETGTGQLVEPGYLGPRHSALGQEDLAGTNGQRGLEGSAVSPRERCRGLLSDSPPTTPPAQAEPGWGAGDSRGGRLCGAG